MRGKHALEGRQDRSIRQRKPTPLHAGHTPHKHTPLRAWLVVGGIDLLLITLIMLALWWWNVLWTRDALLVGLVCAGIWVLGIPILAILQHRRKARK